MKKFAILGVGILSVALLAGCGNNATKNSSDGSNKVSKVVKKTAKKSSKVKQSSMANSQKNTSSAAISSNHSNSNSTGVHLTGGQSTIDYITKLKGDKGWTVEGGTYGGAHGAPTSPDYVPYNVVKSADNSEWYYVYQDGKVVEMKDMEQHDDQNSNSDSNDQTPVNTNNSDDDDEIDE